MQILESFRNIFKIAELRKRVFITLALLVVYRFGCHIALPGVNGEAIQEFAKRGEALGGLWGLIQIFSGGALANLALFSLGIMPYITASIIMQLMTKVSGTLEAMVKEGPAGQRKISQYTRYLTIPICLVQAIFAVRTLVSLQQSENDTQFIHSLGFTGLAEMVIGLMAGAVFVMWLGEQITEHGVGNGASLLIMAGIVAVMPNTALTLVQKARDGAVTTDSLVIVAVLFLGMIAGIVFVTQAQRRIPVQHAKHFRGRRVWMGSRNYLPLRVNTAGVMPVIFASSLLIIPQVLAQIKALEWMGEFFGRGIFVYATFYAAMIIFFSYFWTYLFFQPVEMANNLKEYGSFIPGIRPGENTANYLNSILSRITLCGASFLVVIALLPDLVTAGFGGDLQAQLLTFLGGTGILIVVGVALDIVQKIESYLLMHHYEGFVGPGGIRGRR